jgi:hypothetical protein
MYLSCRLQSCLVLYGEGIRLRHNSLTPRLLFRAGALLHRHHAILPEDLLAAPGRLSTSCLHQRRLQPEPALMEGRGGVARGGAPHWAATAAKES